MKGRRFGIGRPMASLDEASRKFLVGMIKNDPDMNIAVLASRMGIRYRQLRRALSAGGVCSLGSHRRIMGFIIRERRLRQWAEIFYALVKGEPETTRAFRAFCARFGRCGKPARDSGRENGWG